MLPLQQPPAGHPDPDGVKLKTIRTELARTLRQRFPEETTDVLIFDDWMSCPQWPRTDAENVIFGKAMGLMNDVYVHCDCVMHIHADLPETDTAVQVARANLSGFTLHEQGSDVNRKVVLVALPAAAATPSGSGVAGGDTTASLPSDGDVLVHVGGVPVQGGELRRSLRAREGPTKHTHTHTSKTSSHPNSTTL